jgi:hypothetical protein
VKVEFLGKKLRHELKYYIHPYEYVTLRQRLSAMLQLDGNSDDKDGYGIRSYTSTALKIIRFMIK